MFVTGAGTLHEKLWKEGAGGQARSWAGSLPPSPLQQPFLQGGQYWCWGQEGQQSKPAPLLAPELSQATCYSVHPHWDRWIRFSIYQLLDPQAPHFPVGLEPWLLLLRMFIYFGLESHQCFVLFFFVVMLFLEPTASACWANAEPHPWPWHFIVLPQAGLEFSPSSS